MKTIHVTYLVALSSLLALTACDPDDPEVPNEEEVITTVVCTLTPNGGGTTVEMRFEDLDGDGGNAPTITGGMLSTNTTYSAELTLLNESETPAEDITAEIREEDEEHQVFYQSNIGNLSIAYNDQDANGHPLGLSTTMTTTSTGSGTLTITLRHEPDKTAANVADGDIASAGGATDVEVNFPFDIQ